VAAISHRRALVSAGRRAEPATGAGFYYERGLLELIRGRDREAVAAFQAAERLAARMATLHLLAARTRALLVHALVRMGETERAERALASLSETEREHGQIRIAAAALRLAQDDPQAATVALVPVLDGSAPVNMRTWLRYLPTDLSVPEIARELSLSVTTVRTHVRHVFTKLGVHHRTEAVARARALGLLAPSPRSP
jgi:ATP/maltotriose-dependent transcriptional regulator MalT